MKLLCSTLLIDINTPYDIYVDDSMPDSIFEKIQVEFTNIIRQSVMPDTPNYMPQLWELIKGKAFIDNFETYNLAYLNHKPEELIRHICTIKTRIIRHELSKHNILTLPTLPDADETLEFISTEAVMHS